MALAFDDAFPKARLALLLKHFSGLDDGREAWRVAYPIHEVLLVVTCATIASCDDFDEIVAWGEHNLAFLRRFSPLHHGVPCARWLRDLLNRVDPALFAACLEAWIAEMWPGRHAFIAIDGKTARRTHDRGKGLKALHTLSAYATTARLTLAQLSVPEKTNEITTIPDLLDHLAQAGQLEGALVTIDAMGCQVEIARKIVDHKADYLLALKGNQSILEADVLDYFRTAPADELTTTTTVEIRPRPHRDPHLPRLRQRRLDRLRPPLSRRSPLPPHRHPRPGPRRHRTSRQVHRRDPDLSLLRPPRHRTPRPGRSRPLGRRKHALAPRRHLQGRPLALSTRPRGQEHGRHPPLRPRPRPKPQVQGQCQNPPKNRRMEPGLPAQRASAPKPLTRTPCRAGWTA